MWQTPQQFTAISESLVSLSASTALPVQSVVLLRKSFPLGCQIPSHIPVSMNDFLLLGCQTPMQFDFLGLLVVYSFYTHCYPSFGCVRKQNISTYPSILAGILKDQIFFIVVQVELSPFSPHYDPLPHLFPPPTLKTISFSFVHVSFIHVP